MMMAPSVGFLGGGGGDEPTGTGTLPLAFMSGNKAPSLRRRTSSSATPSIATTTSTTCLSSSSSSSLADDSFYRGGDQSLHHQQQQQERIARPDEPNLFNFPPKSHPTYRPMPILLQASIAIASALLVGRRSLSSINFSPLSSLFNQLSQKLFLSTTAVVIRKALSFLLRTALVSTIAKLALQEAFYPPSRVTTQYLADRGELPSTLSRYQTVTPLAICAPITTQPDGRGEDKRSRLTTTMSSWTEEEEDDGATLPAPIGVHSLQYTKQRTATKSTNNNSNKYDGIYLHHGFGASSLSWLPVLPSLVEQLGNSARKSVGVAHDAPGFGFTDRPNADLEGGLEHYGSENNVGIGLALLKESLLSKGKGSEESAGENVDGVNKPKSIAIFGHSMGSKAALLMALTCALEPKSQFQPKLVVLVAPALEGVALPSSRGGKQSTGSGGKQSKKKSWIRKMVRKVWIAWRKVFLDYPFQYGLRRLVGGRKDFWRKGLSLAWGDPNRLSDSDILRFQWPSIGKGWEKGLINFTRSKLPSSPSPYALNDGQLLREVSNQKDTKVVIVYGSKDRVVRIEGEVAEMLEREYPHVKLVRMEGSGHDPFEEDVDGFLLELEKALLE